MVPLMKNIDRGQIMPRVCVLSVRDGNPLASQLEKINVPVDLVPIKNLRDLSGFKRLIHYIRSWRPDIVHTQLETSDILGTLASRYLHVPSVSTLHTVNIPSKKRRTYWRSLVRWKILGSFANRVIAVSETTRQVHLKLGIHAEKLKTLYNGIDLEEYLTIELNHRQNVVAHDFPEDRVVIVTVAVLRELKGIQFMLNAIPEIMKRVPNLCYVIVGDGSYRASLEKLTMDLGISEQVKFLGYRNDIPAILAKSDLFVFPTLQDALPTVLFEAMAAGLPIVASGVGGVPEILHDNETGLIVLPAYVACLAAACLRLLNDKQLSGRMSALARKTVTEKFNIQTQIDGLVNIYDQVILET
jgi:glycosyltransferase involved in cell wall biosynthesis